LKGSVTIPSSIAPVNPKVIPREGVESNKDIFAELTDSLIVIPREGVERIADDDVDAENLRYHAGDPERGS